MSKATLLELVQNIMLACEMDDVNTIADTPEAQMVAEEIRTSYYELFSDKFMPSNKSLIQLEGLSDILKPNYLKLPDNVKEIDWFRYNYRDLDGRPSSYQEVKYLDPELFVMRVLGQDDESVDVQEVVDFSGVTLAIRSDAHPSVWTTFDNLYLVTNSWDSTVDTTLHAAQSVCWGTLYRQWEAVDDFVPPLDEHLFPLLLAEAKSVVFLNHKQVANKKEEQRATRQMRRSQNDLFRMNQKIALPDYGRK